MSLPPYIPGLTLAVIGTLGALTTLAETFDPTSVANYTDSQIVRICAAVSLLANAWLARWIGNRMLAVIEANTAALQHHTAVMESQLDDYKTVGQKAIEAAMNHKP